MPGIVGIISKGRRDNAQHDIEQMIDCMTHESDCISGTFIDEQLGLSIGWFCRPGAFSDCMPVQNEKKDLVLIFTGENFADKEVFDYLKSRHHAFDHTNASYLIHCYEEKGIEFLRDLNGCFSGLLVNTQAKTSTLFIDRYGAQRIYFYESLDAFYFSSEAKALLRICPHLKEIDTRGIAEMLHFHGTLEGRTLFKNIQLLPAASAWEFCQGGEVKRNTYFDKHEWEAQPWLETEYFYEKLKGTFAKILPRYFRSIQSLGIILTGDLGTRIIMALAPIPPSNIPSCTLRRIEINGGDIDAPLRIAELCQLKHIILAEDERFISEFPRYAEKTIYASDGYLGVQKASDLYLYGLAGQIAPAFITGQYGADLFFNGENSQRMGSLRKGLYTTEIISQFDIASDTMICLKRNSSCPLSEILFLKLPWLLHMWCLLVQAHIALRMPFMDNELAALMYRISPGVLYRNKLSLRLIIESNLALSRIPYSQSRIRRWLLLDKGKYHRFRSEYQSKLKNYAQDILLDERTLTRPFLQRKSVEKLVRGYLSNNYDLEIDIAQLLDLELTQRLLIEERT